MNFLKNWIPGLMILSVLAMLSCEKIDDPFEGIDQGGGNPSVDTNDTIVVINADTLWGDTSNTTIRKMLIEEISGHTCGNCPPKTKILTDIVEDEYLGKVYSVVYHATSFANPVRDYTADFRTEKGTAFNASLGNNGDAPVALFSRNGIKENDFGLISGSKFRVEFDALVGSGYFDSPKFQLKIRNIYNKDTKKNTLSITATALTAITEQHTLVIQVIEDNIISDQKWYGAPGGDHVHDYEHRHMFRGAIGDLNGNSFIPSGLNSDESITKAFATTLDDSWNHKNCRFIVSLRNNSTGQIVQTDEVHAIKE